MGLNTPSQERLLRSLARELRAAGVDNADQEAAWLAAGCLGCPAADLWRHAGAPVAPEAAARCTAALRRRLAGEPLAYILGNQEFGGLTLQVGPGALIPRPETEELVERVLERLPAPAAGEAPRLLDACTGPGTIACVLASRRPDAAVFAMDLESAALAWARRNRAALGLANLHLWQGDLLDALRPAARFTVIVANPPYIPESAWPSLAPGVRDHEPRSALLASDNGLAVLQRLTAAAGRHLSPGGWLLCEIGHDQEAAALGLCANGGLREAAVHRDLAGQPRYLLARTPVA